MANLKVNDNFNIGLSNNVSYNTGDIIIYYSSSSLPDGWLDCNGQTLLVSDYGDLYNKIGVYYGGTAGTNFNLPNLNGSTVAASVKAVYPTGVIGTTNSQTAALAYTQHTHGFSTNPTGTTDAYTSPNHGHNFSYNMANATDSHNHNELLVLSGGTAWTNGASNIANYSSSGSSGSHSYSSHKHNHGGSNIYSSALGTVHTHGVAATMAVTGSTNHSHVITTTMAATPSDSTDLYPLTKLMRFAIKV